jgi:hypothetical protein
MAGSGLRGSPQPPPAHRLRPSAGVEHRALGGLHAHRRAQGAARAQSQPDRQRHAAARAGLPPRLRRGQPAERDQHAHVDQRVAVRRADLPAPAAVPAGDVPGALHAGGRLFLRRIDRQPLRGRPAAGLRQALRRRRVGAQWPRRATSLRGHGRLRAALRHPALAHPAAGQRPALQPDGRHRPQPGWDQQRPVHRSGHGPAGVAERRARRQHVHRGPARDEVRAPRRHATYRRLRRAVQPVQHGQPRLGLQRQRAERALPAADGLPPSIGYPFQAQLGARFTF